MTLTFYLVIGGFLVAQLGFLAWITTPRRPPPPVPELPARRELMLEQRVAALELTVKGLPSLWEAERSRAEAAANSARTARARAERLHREIEELGEADPDVRGDDGAEGPRERVPAVPQNLGPHPQPDDYSRQVMNSALFNLSPI